MKQVIVIGIMSSIVTFLNCGVVAIGQDNRFCNNIIPDVLQKSNKMLMLTLERGFYSGFGGARWGMSREEVRGCFPDKEFHSRGGILWFSDKIADEHVDIIFDFFEDKLYTVHIRIKPGAIITQAYIFKFFKFEDLMIKRYGEPVRKIRKGSLDPYVSDADAISMGRGMYSSIWHAPESNITLSLQGANYEMHMWIEYECLELAKKKSKEKND
ncbi:MAG: hypothetical protein ACUBOA_08045 [Candidatus Loosdrechtia sp.]|uniref:hypothetical protein n=1 Tax=Candidatus Loosdrechtia sp. TaxID=3101272 RepID=UPI003A76549E|nr:MAG: hypothetical protein QY305_06430 [Candidatus Jettenia sp. AMX2]